MIKIAIVEDDRPTREGLEAIINLTPGYRCVGVFGTGAEALRALPELQPEVVLMDIQLPRMDGIECVARLKATLPAVEVIMVTVYEDAERIFRALRAGASGYVLKRAPRGQLLAAIQDVREGGVPMSSEIGRKVIGYFKQQETAASEMEKLTVRQREILDLTVEGFSNKEIADRLGISLNSLRWHLKNIYHQLHVHSRTEIMAKFRSRI